MTGGEAAAAHAAAIAQAIKALGAIVRVEPAQFEAILARQREPLVVQAVQGLFSTSYRYLTGYKGLVFFTKSRFPLPLPTGCELITAERIWIPG